MRLEAGTHSDWTVIDAATGGEIKDVIMLDDATKEMRRYVREGGKWALEPTKDGPAIKRSTITVRAVHIDLDKKIAKVYL